tara:strand:- start:228 stop:434 length:207 start_codon:yes stop_codon:yes gene_type:complete
MSEETKSNCSRSSNCYAVTALCVSLLVLGLLVGNWIGKCQKTKKCNKIENVDKKACAPGCEKACCKKK